MPATVILTSAPDLKTADKIARLLVTQKLAACVTISPAARSVYRWKGRVTAQPERVLTIKTRSELFHSIERCFRRAHPYEVPELISIPAARISRSYSAWLNASLK